ncbi:phosphonate C-P lyase system protein PhnG, partial [Bordetella petrii]|uniref:phosphonate C-P lyase system protein PhnG n=1 Tax=Bordetella petrii TaxID=94624 RepID=UPI001E377C84
ALPAHNTLRPAESGMAMVRARAGGTGAQFNLGEMTITRCAVTLDDGTMGVGYVPGRSRRHAEHAAVLDALLQQDAWHDRIQAGVIKPLARAHAERARRQAQVAAQTQVEFFTMVRGED